MSQLGPKWVLQHQYTDLRMSSCSFKGITSAHVHAFYCYLCKSPVEYKCNPFPEDVSSTTISDAGSTNANEEDDVKYHYVADEAEVFVQQLKEQQEHFASCPGVLPESFSARQEGLLRILNGLFLQPDFLSVSEEQEIVDCLDGALANPGDVQAQEWVVSRTGRRKQDYCAIQWNFKKKKTKVRAGLTEAVKILQETAAVNEQEQIGHSYISELIQKAEGPSRNKIIAEALQTVRILPERICRMLHNVSSYVSAEVSWTAAPCADIVATDDHMARDLGVEHPYIPFEISALDYQAVAESSTNESCYLDPHIDDAWLWGPRIGGVSLCASTTMTFTGLLLNEEKQAEKNSGDFDDQSIASIHVPLPRRALFVMSGDVRYRALHGISEGALKHTYDTDPKYPGRRISLTIRELSKEIESEMDKSLVVIGKIVFQLSK